MKTRFRVIRGKSELILCALCCLLFLSAGDNPAYSQKAQNGLVKLTSGWQMRWGDSPVDEHGVPLWTYGDKTDSGWMSTDQTYNPPGRNGRDFVWFRCLLPGVPIDDAAVFSTNIFIAADVYVDGQHIYSFGSFEPRRDNKYNAARWHLFDLRKSGRYLYFRIYSDDPKNIGIPIMADNVVLLGSERQLFRYVILQSIDRFVLGCLFALIGLISLDLFFHRWHRRGKKTYHLLAFGAFSVSVGLFFAIGNEISQFVIPSYKLRFLAAGLGMFLFPVGLFAFIESVLDTPRKKLIRTTWLILLGYGTLGLILELANVLRYAPWFYIIWSFLLIGAFIVGLAVGFRPALSGHVEMRIFYFGFAATMLFVLHDYLTIYGVIPYWRWMSHWGVLLFVMSLQHIIAFRNTKDQDLLEKNARELKAYSENLENMVEERTSDLQDKNEELSDTLSALKETQQQLMIKEKLASLGKLVAGIAHEVNNPIGAVNSASDVVDRALTKIHRDIHLQKNPELDRVLKVIAENSEIIKTGSSRVVKLVQSLKNFSRLDEAEFQEADIHEGLESTLTLLHHELKNKVTVIREYGDIPTVNCFPNELNQVFMNLFVNAAQAIQEKGTLSVRTHADGKFVYIEVTDTGAGISAENLGKIFDPGFTTKGVGIGTGLGLAISYSIIKKHKGDIHVESEVGRGTTFKIVLPVDLS